MKMHSRGERAAVGAYASETEDGVPHVLRGLSLVELEVEAGDDQDEYQTSRQPPLTATLVAQETTKETHGVVFARLAHSSRRVHRGEPS